MFYNNFGDAEALWVNVANVALGLVVLICCAVVAGGIVQEFALRRRKRAVVGQEIDHDLRRLAGGYSNPLDDHSFHVPELGLTMADGGEPVKKPRAARKTREKDPGAKR